MEPLSDIDWSVVWIRASEDECDSFITFSFAEKLGLFGCLEKKRLDVNLDMGILVIIIINKELIGLPLTLWSKERQELIQVCRLRSFTQFVETQCNHLFRRLYTLL